MKKRLLALLMVMAMVLSFLVACTSKSSDSTTDGTTAAGGDDATTTAAETTTPGNEITGDIDSDDAFVVWGWNGDILKILDALYKSEDWYSRVVFINTGGTSYYQTKIDAILDKTDDPLYPDIMGLESDYIRKYVNSDYLLSVSDLGITEDDMANMYEYNLQLGTDVDGNVKALYWQATPGSWQLRADLCEKYLGTTDPTELQAMFKDWDTVIETAKKVNDASDGKVKLLSGYTDVFRVFSNSRTDAWYNSDDVITVDDSMNSYMEIAKTMYDDELTYNTTQWSTDWYSNMAGDGDKTNAALAYTGCPWFTYWCLDADKTLDDGTAYEGKWTANTILIEGPQSFFWGGSGLAATAGCSDKELAGTIIKGITCDTDMMVKINALNSDFVNNKEAIQQIIDAGNDGCALIYGSQSYLDFYLPLADKIDASTVTAEDLGINDIFALQVDNYAQGKSTLDEAIDAFKAAVHDSYSYLNVE